MKTIEAYQSANGEIFTDQKEALDRRKWTRISRIRAWTVWSWRRKTRNRRIPILGNPRLHDTL